MEGSKVSQIHLGKPISSGKVPTVSKISSRSAASSQTHETPQSGGIHPSGLDQNGNCKINIFSPVPQGEPMVQYPNSRCYFVETSNAAGQVLQTSGFALSPNRVLTSSAHVVNLQSKAGSCLIQRSYSFVNEDGSVETEFDSHYASRVVFWDNPENEPDIGLRYCMFALDTDPLTITDEAGENVFTTITSVLELSSEPTLQLLTRDVQNSTTQDATLMSGEVTGAPRQVTTGHVAEWFSTDLGGWLGRHDNAFDWDYLRGSPIFVTEEMGPPNGPLTTMAWLVGLVTDEVVASSPCTVNAGLFTDLGGVTRLLDALN